MKTITNKEYNEYLQLLHDKRNGHNLTFEALEMIVRANNFDPLEIGKDILQAYFSIKRRRKYFRDKGAYSEISKLE